MTKSLSILALMAATAALWGCSSHDNYEQPKGYQAEYITITTNIAGATRLGSNNVSTYFVPDDSVSIYAWTGANDAAPPADLRVVDNSINVLDASQEWIAKPQMLWKNPYERHYFVGVYPANKTSVADMANVPYTLDTGNQERSDVLIATKSDGVLPSKYPVDLEFRHVMSRLLVSATFGDQWGGQSPKVDKVVLGNVATSATINYATRTVTPTTDRRDLELPESASDQYLSVLVPQSGVNTVTFTIEGKEYSYTHPTDIELKSDRMVFLYLNVGRDEISLRGMRIVNWGVGDVIDANTSGYNTAKYITDKSKLNMVYSLVDKEMNRGRIYEMNYTADYKLDDALQANITSLAGLQNFVAKKLYDKQPSSAPMKGFDAGCSAFAASETGTGNYLMGRNYDFCHKNADGKETDIAAIVVKTNRFGAKRTVSVVDGYWLGMNKGFFTDGKTDLSMLMAAPYAFMDGINEDGFAIGVLHLDGKPTVQTEQGKPNVFMNVAMRMLLDRAANINEAIELLNQHNMHMTSPAGGNFHFYMADATGRYAIVEYVSPKGDINENPWKIDVMTDNDRYRYVTNFYVSDLMRDTPYGQSSSHGKDRYEKMETTLWNCNFTLDMNGARSLLSQVSQAPNVDDPTSHTQWSSIYNLSSKSLTLYLLREYYGRQAFEFGIK